tara:strand:+ start:789 stop:1163 length:375 start_codon:yes stop_codon:yes gene_type:complete
MATSRNKNNNYNPTGKPASERNVVRYFTKDNLKKAILHAENTDKARSVYSSTVFAFLKDHDKNTKYPVVFDMIHNQVELRMRIAISEDVTIMLDVDYDKVDKWSSWTDHDGPATLSLGDINEQS